MRFEWPLLLWGMPVLVLAVLGLARWGQRRRLALAARWSPEAVVLATRSGRGSLPLLAMTALCAGVALAGPRGALGPRTTEGEGLNVLLAVDISRSMLAEDVEPSRLQHAVGEAMRLVQDLSADRIGVMAFAGQPYLLSPLTLDHSAAMLYLRTVDPEMATAGGSNLAALFQRATEVLDQAAEGGDRVLVLFSDGEAHDDPTEILAAARGLGAVGVRLLVVPVGGAAPVRIPRRDLPGPTLTWHRGPDGSEVRTARQDALLRAIAEAAGGRLLPPGVRDHAGDLRADLDRLSRRPLEERRLSDLRPLAWVPTLLAALLLLAHAATRRGAALIALALVFAAADAGAQRPAPPNDTLQFNRGTAALRAGDHAAARQLLGEAARSLDPDLRARAWYNLGLAALRQSRREPTERQALEREAVAAFRQALLLVPASADAKWNLELLVRPRPPASATGGAPPPRPGPGEGPSGAPAPGLSLAEAEALLAAAAESEVRSRVGVLRRQRVGSAAARKDW